MTEEKVVKKKKKIVDVKRVKSDSKFYEFWSGKAIKAEARELHKGNRYDRRKRIRQPLAETLRQAKRVDRMMEIKEMAKQIKEWYPDVHMDIANQIKKWYPKTYKEVTLDAIEFFPKSFKHLDKWKEIEAEMVKLLSRKGETNSMPKKKRRK